MRKVLALGIIGILTQIQNRASAIGVATNDLIPTVTQESHPNFGEISFEFSMHAPFTSELKGSRVTLYFARGVKIPELRSLPRNVFAVVARDNIAEITIPFGARSKVRNEGNRVIVTVSDPNDSLAVDAAQKKPSSVKPSFGGLKTVGRNLSAIQAEPAVYSKLPPDPPLSAPMPVPAAPIDREPLAQNASPADPWASPAPTPPSFQPIEIAARLLPQDDAAMVVPFPQDVSAAAFRRGTMGVIVFGDSRPLDLRQVQNSPSFSQATIQLLPTATVLRLPLPATQRLSLSRDAEGWQVRVTPSLGASALQPTLTANGLDVSTPAAGKVVVLPKTAEDQFLLVGTLLPQKGSALGVAVQRRNPEFTLGTSWMGVVVEPYADRIQLRAEAGGFRVINSKHTLAASASDYTSPMQPAHLTRRFDFPSDDDATLFRRMQAQLQNIAAAPPRSRFSLRLGAVQTMLALGLNAEASALIDLAQAEAPEVPNPDAGALKAIAELMSGRLDQAAGLDDPALDGTDEIALWRETVRFMQNEDAAGSGDVMASALPLILSYPNALRTRLLPLAADALLANGPAGAIDSLLQSYPDEPTLAFARASREAAVGKSELALQHYDAIAAGRDRRLRARATLKATELRHSIGLIGDTAAADALRSSALGWRGDPRERSILLRCAELYRNAKSWRSALESLKDADRLFPDGRAAIRTQAAKVFEAMLAPDVSNSIAALDLVALTEDFAEFLPDGPPGAALTTLLADKLILLDLPDRAVSVLERLMHVTTAGPAQADLGLKIATLRLEGHDPRRAVAALQASDTAGLPAPSIEARTLLLARANAEQGDSSAALAALATIDTAAGDDLRAELLEKAGDWHGALLALSALAKKAVPDAGELSDAQQQIILRLATAAAQLGDVVRLAEIRDVDGPRMAPGAKADILRVLTGKPVRNVGDLPRASAEMALARSLSDRINGF